MIEHDLFAAPHRPTRRPVIGLAQALSAREMSRKYKIAFLLAMICGAALLLGGGIAYWSLRSVRPVGRMATIMEKLDESVRGELYIRLLSDVDEALERVLKRREDMRLAV